MYTTLYSIVSRCQDVAQLLSLSTCTRRLVLWCRRVDSTASICFSAGVPLYILYLFSRTLALAVLDRTARHWSSAVTWPHTSKVGKHASSTCTCNNPKAPVSWICLLSVGSVYAQEPIMDGWWSVISLNCNLELCPHCTVSLSERWCWNWPGHARAGMWNAVKLVKHTAAETLSQGCSLRLRFSIPGRWTLSPPFTFKSSAGISVLIAKDFAGKASK